MKKIFNLIAVGMVLASVNVNAQTYVNEMTQADVERDCYIEGGSALFNDAADAYYGDGSYVQKSSASTPTAFIFNRDIWGNKNLTGFIVNVLVPNDRMDFDQFIKIEYSTDELNYQEVPDMKVEKSYDAVLGNNYWIDVWYQGALPDFLLCRAVSSISYPQQSESLIAVSVIRSCQPVALRTICRRLSELNSGAGAAWFHPCGRPPR